MGADPARTGRVGTDTNEADERISARPPAEPAAEGDAQTPAGASSGEAGTGVPAEAVTPSPADNASDKKARKAAAKARRQQEKAEAKARREEEKRLEEERRATAEEADRVAREKAAKESAARAVEAVSAAGGFNVMGVLREVAKPRLTGSHGAHEVGGTIRACFEALGYDVEGRDFTFSPWPGRFGITAAGVLYLVGTVTAAAFLYAGNAYGALGILLVLFVLVGMMALLIRPAIDAMPWGRQTGTNLMVTRPGARPRYIIMAHRDSKSQPIPLAFRGPAIIVGVLSWMALLVSALAHTARPLHPTIILVLGVLAAVSGLILIFCWVDNRSPGALDNASGVVTALNIAAREADAGDVAFLITDAEELGLAGARAAAPHLPAVFGVINIDGLDDDGPFYVLERFGTIRKQGIAPHLAVALLQEAEARGEAADRRDMPFGIPVDHIPIVKAGTPALTLMRGTTGSLRRVHRATDDLDALQGDGVRRGADLVCGALARLREQSRTLER